MDIQHLPTTLEKQTRVISRRFLRDRTVTKTVDFADVLRSVALVASDQEHKEAAQRVERVAAHHDINETKMAAPRTFGGFVIPWSMTRDLTVGTATAGGNLVGDHRISFGGVLLEELRLVQLGASFLGGLNGNVNLARLLATPSLEWVTEGSAASESQSSFGLAQMVPHHLCGHVDVSRRLIKQSSVDVMALVMRQFARVVAGLVERAAIQGTGGTLPLGILNDSDVPVISMGTDGGAPTWAKVVELEKTVDAANTIGARPGFLINGATRAKMHTTQRFTGSDTTLYEGLQRMGPVAVTNNVPSDLTKGSGTDLSAMVFGNWADLLIGSWGGIELMANPHIHGMDGSVRILVHMHVDVAIGHAESFGIIKDIDNA